MNTIKQRMIAVLESTRLWPRAMPAAVRASILDAEAEAILNPAPDSENEQALEPGEPEPDISAVEARAERRAALRQAAYKFTNRPGPEAGKR